MKKKYFYSVVLFTDKENYEKTGIHEVDSLAAAELLTKEKAYGFYNCFENKDKQEIISLQEIERQYRIDNYSNKPQEVELTGEDKDMIINLYQNYMETKLQYFTRVLEMIAY